MTKPQCLDRAALGVTLSSWLGTEASLAPGVQCQWVCIWGQGHSEGVQWQQPRQASSGSCQSILREPETQPGKAPLGFPELHSHAQGQGPGSNTCAHCGDPDTTALPSVISLSPQKKDHSAHGSITSSQRRAFLSNSLAEIYFPVRSPLGNK